VAAPDKELPYSGGSFPIGMDGCKAGQFPNESDTKELDDYGCMDLSDHVDLNSHLEEGINLNRL
jgi:hypothetical protein